MTHKRTTIIMIVVVYRIDDGRNSSPHKYHVNIILTDGAFNNLGFNTHLHTAK